MNFKADLINKTKISQEVAETIILQFDKLSLPTKGKLLERGTQCDKYYFLESGIIRFSLLNKNIDETAWVVFENTFFTDIFSLLDSKPSFLEISAIENSILYSIDKDKLNEVSETIPIIKDYLLATWEQNFRNIAEIKMLQQFGDAKMRYGFFQKNEQWMQQVPQKMLASYIGITPFSLSRIRRKK